MANVPFQLSPTNAAGGTVFGANTVLTPNGVQVKAMAGNTGKVYIGVSTSLLATTAFELSAGEGLLIPPSIVQDLSGLWALGSAASQKLCVWVL